MQSVEVKEGNMIQFLVYPLPTWMCEEGEMEVKKKKKNQNKELVKLGSFSLEVLFLSHGIIYCTYSSVVVFLIAINHEGHYSLKRCLSRKYGSNK